MAIHKNFPDSPYEIPVLSPCIYREYKRLEDLEPSAFNNKKIIYREFSEEQKREIVFKDIISGEISHTAISYKSRAQKIKMEVSGG